MDTQYLAICGKDLVVRGSLKEIVYGVKAFESDIEPIVFEEDTCRRIDFSWHGDVLSVLANASTHDEKTTKRGRPKLGVKAKEVTLLPRHWEWLSIQKGGASAALRRLVDEAQNNATTEDVIYGQQRQLDKFMMAFLGDEPGFEEASRALYRNSKVSFELAIESWPTEIKDFVLSKFMRISDVHSGMSAS